MPEKIYNEDYFERGIEKGVSCYQNYRWMPKATIPFCMSFIDYLDIKRDMTILDFGCAKGFLVKGFRWLHRQAFGIEISTYCIINVDPEVREFIFNKIPKNMRFDWIISKDTFEHIPYNEIGAILKKLALSADNMFCIIPLADNLEFRIPSYEMDMTHIIRENEEWWEKVFIENGWEVVDFRYSIPGMKENWTKGYPKGNGFWKLKTKKGIGRPIIPVVHP